MSYSVTLHDGLEYPQPYGCRIATMRRGLQRKPSKFPPFQGNLNRIKKRCMKTQGLGVVSVDHEMHSFLLLPQEKSHEITSRVPLILSLNLFWN